MEDEFEALASKHKKVRGLGEFIHAHALFCHRNKALAIASQAHPDARACMRMRSRVHTGQTDRQTRRERARTHISTTHTHAHTTQAAVDLEFESADADTDKKISIEEWKAVFFHEDPQVPESVSCAHTDTNEILILMK